MTETVKKQENEFRSQIIRIEQRLEKKENDIENKLRDLDQSKANIEKQRDDYKQQQEEVRLLKQQQLANIEKIAEMSRDDAKKVLMDNTERMIKEDMVALYRKTIGNAREEADKKAREIVAHAIERCAAEVTTETTTTVVHIPSEEMKGRIIGKEGRNIRAFETMMGVEILI